MAKKKQPPRLAYISHPTRMNVEKYFHTFSLGTFAFIPTAFNHILTETFLWQSGVVRQPVELDKENMKTQGITYPRVN